MFVFCGMVLNGLTPVLVDLEVFVYVSGDYFFLCLKGMLVIACEDPRECFTDLFERSWRCSCVYHVPCECICVSGASFVCLKQDLTMFCARDDHVRERSLCKLTVIRSGHRKGANLGAGTVEHNKGRLKGRVVVGDMKKGGIRSRVRLVMV